MIPAPVDQPDDALNWRTKAACLGSAPALFFPGRGESTAEAKAVCRGCPVCRECLAFALACPASEDAGIWGGTSEKDRRGMRWGKP